MLSLFILCVGERLEECVSVFRDITLFYTNAHMHTHSYTHVCSHNGVLVNRPHARWWFPQMITELKNSCRLVTSLLHSAMIMNNCVTGLCSRLPHYASGRYLRAYSSYLPSLLEDSVVCLPGSHRPRLTLAASQWHRVLISTSPRVVMCCAGLSRLHHIAQVWGGPDQPGSSALTMVAQQQNPLTTCFSQWIPVVKQYVTVFRHLSLN